ncbi:hypothetical protein MHK_005738, partial [Candidatus Magnetomorum sp. HK-1]
MIIFQGKGLDLSKLSDNVCSQPSGYIRSGFKDVSIFKIDMWELSNFITMM